MSPRGQKPRGMNSSNIHTCFSSARNMVSEDYFWRGRSVGTNYSVGGEKGVSIRDLRAAGQISTISWSSMAALIVWVACW